MPRPRLEDLLPLAPGLEAARAEKYLAGFEEDYFRRFDLPEIARHLERISRLGDDNLLEVIFAHQEDGGIIECTVVSYDHQGIFSLITGVFAATGFHIQSGEAFTCRPPAAAGPRRGRRLHGRYRRPAPSPGRRPIIDHFRGYLDVPMPAEVWGAEFSNRLRLLLQLLFSGRGSEGQRQARRRINEMVTQYLVANRQEQAEVLYPVEIEILPRKERQTVQLKVVAQDTPAFLFTLSNTLALQGFSIDHVQIRTVGDRVEDLLEISEPGMAGTFGPGGMEKLKLAVLLTKQFTYFLDRAPDPYAALSRFETLLPDILVHPDSRAWVNFLANPRAMDELAHVLGTSDFLWEDFIRLQYEMLLPILKSHLAGQEVFEPIETVDERLAAALAAGDTYEEKQRLLNEFKDRELFLIDLHHIIDARTTFRDLAEDLTRLAEAIVRQAAALVFQQLAARYGQPQTVAGLEVAYAVFGLGKLGGAALGYASDIELLFVYDDNGETAGPQKITNSDFFSQLAAGVAAFIVTKKKGIFAIDYRLRPYGESGPLGVSLENFCRYYGPGGPAHSYERLALVRLRWIGGDRELGARIERLRDQYIYESDSIDLEELSQLRRRQFEEKARPGRYNAKFSPGALVDIEYSVQILQVISRGGGRQLRTPRVHEALTALRDSGILDADECRQLNAAYDFLRQLINALRMLRGSAEDLYLPPVDADEFTHLARRMGYRRSRDFSAARQLLVDFATHTAIVRSFVERHLGRKSLPAPTMGSVADLILNERLSAERRQAIMGQYGFANVERACTNFLSLAGEGERRELFVKLAVLACDILRRESAPDLALNNWERFVASLTDPVAHYNLLFSQPRRLEILLGIFSRSQFLANTLIRHPDFLAWVTAHETLYGQRTKARLQLELRTLAASSPAADWLGLLRRFRQREILRIGTCDLCLQFPFSRIVRDLSLLAEALIQESLEEIWEDLARNHPGLPARELAASFCVLAFGKLGGAELNYSSDIDLLGVYDEEATAGLPLPDSLPAAKVYYQVMERLRQDLASHTEQGYVYRVDLRLRPYGSSGPLVPSRKALENYYRRAAGLWELQAALKLRPVAGSLDLGADLLKVVRRLQEREFPPAEVAAGIDRMRREAIQRQARKPGEQVDVKDGPGGIRDVEFLLQGLQLINAHRYPEIITGNTLAGLEQLGKFGLLPSSVVSELREDYIFLRTVEHFLQIFDDQQKHLLPADPRELLSLAKRVSGREAGTEQFLRALETVRERVHGYYCRYLQLPA